MKRFFKYAGIVLLGIVGLLLLTVFLLYLSPVQQALRKPILDYLARRTGWVVQAADIRLKFPLSLALKEVYAGATATDTLAFAESVTLDVGLRRIWQKELGIHDLSLRKARVNWKDSTGLVLAIRLDDFALDAPVVSLAKKRVEAGNIRLSNGTVDLTTGSIREVDTVAGKPLDWTFLVQQIRLQQVAFQMNTSAMPYLGAGADMLEVGAGEIALGLQTVGVDSIRAEGAWCDMRTTSTEEPLHRSESAVAGEPWTVTAGRIALANSLFSWQQNGESHTDVVLSGIALQVDSVYNRGMEVRARLADLRAVEAGGASVTAMRALVESDTAQSALSGVMIRTPYSRVRLDARLKGALQDIGGGAPLAVAMDAQVGLQDIAFFYPEIPRSLWDKSVALQTTLSMTEKRLQIGQFILSLPGAFHVTGSGRLTSWKDIRKANGRVVVKGNLPNISFVEQLLPLDSSFRIPSDMNLLVRLEALRGNFDVLTRLFCGQGYVEADASWHPVSEGYIARIVMKDFPVGSFLPRDSLGKASVQIAAEGKHYDWAHAQGEVDMRIGQFVYRGHDYREVGLQVSLHRGRLAGNITSADPEAPVDLVFKGDSVGQAYRINLSGRIGDMDFGRLHLMKEPFGAGLKVDAEAEITASDSYAVRLTLDSIRISDAVRQYYLGNFRLDLESMPRRTSVEVASGDLKLHFKADTSFTAFVAETERASQLIENQVERRRIDMEEVHTLLPLFDLHLEAARENAVTRFLKVRGMGFRYISADIVSRKRAGLRVGVQAYRPYFRAVVLDSLRLGAWQSGKSLVYSMNAGSAAEEWKGLFNMNLSGRMVEDNLRLELRQKDSGGKVGFDLGANLVMRDTAFEVVFFPVNPMLAYNRWSLNEDNRVEIYSSRRIEANLNMTCQHKEISVQSLPDEGNAYDRLQLKISGVDLRQLSQIAPFMPYLGGILNTDILLYTQAGMTGARGALEVSEMYYENKRVGTVDLNLQYAGRESFTRHAVEFDLGIDSVRRAIVKGEFATSPDNKNVVVDADIPSLPMYVANAFLPDGVMELGGELTGKCRIRGTWEQPEINGQLLFREGRAKVTALGTTFRLDTIPLPVTDGKVIFKQYRFMAPDNSTLVLDGEMLLTPFDRMRMDLDMKANRFEVVNVRKNEHSLVYGKGYADIAAGLKGLFSNLALTGNVHLLNSTALTYVLRSSDPTLVDKSAGFVRFVSFRDSTLNEEEERAIKAPAGSFSMRMMIEIGDRVSVGVDLSEDAANQVNIQGGGTLVLVMNPESGMTLSGKYILSDGTVAYNVPIVGKKEFTIRAGSFVEWTGNVMNPLLGISASEQVKANVEDGEQSRQVVFEAIIRIQGNLSRPDITFDLSAPNDMVVQNQLTTFSPEERTRQALNLLIYNTYTAPGAAKSNAGTNVANNALYSFVENELNKYTRKAGLTVGFDSHNTEDNMTRTDVTYQFSKQLFNDRVRVKIGGRISTDNNENQNNNLQDNLVDDISIEYVLTRKRNLYLKVFRHSNYESVLEGEVTQTGVGVVWRKTFRKFKDLFKNKNREERRLEKEKKQRMQ